MKQALTIAGSDSGGGAGIQGDLKTMLAHGVFGTSVVTAITAQNTFGITDTHDVPVATVEAQLVAVLDEFDIAAAKTGMLVSSAIVRTVAHVLGERQISNIVVDPVMVATSGQRLLRADAIDVIKGVLLPLALCVTPNLHEAEVLAEMRIESADDMRQSARRIREYGCRAVLITGGHAAFDRATDVLFDGREVHTFPSQPIAGKIFHGAGCAFSAAIVARLARGEPLLAAVGHAKAYVSRALATSPDIGTRHAVLNHFYSIGSDDGSE